MVGQRESWPLAGGGWGYVETKNRARPLTSRVRASSRPGTLAPLLSWLSPQGPDWAGDSTPWGGLGLGAQAAGGLSDPGWPEGLGASRPRPHSERSSGLSGTQSCAVVTSVPGGPPGPVGHGCCPPVKSARVTSASESEPAGGEGGVSPRVVGPFCLALLARPCARSCWARSRCSAPSSRGSCRSTRAPGRPSRPVGSTQASVSLAFRPCGWGLPGPMAGPCGLLWGLRRCRGRRRFRRQRLSACRECFRGWQAMAEGREARRTLWVRRSPGPWPKGGPRFTGEGLGPGR